MSQVQAQRFQRTVSIVRIAIIMLVAITALIHLQRGIGMSMGGFGGGAPGGPPPGGGAGRPRGGPPGGFNIFQFLPLPLPVLFLLNGIGYLVLVTALYLPALARYRSIVRWLLILFAAATIVMYFLVNGFHLNPLSVIDKAAEVALIVLLLIEGRQSGSSAAVEAVGTRGEPK
jgi:hypothetical protein